jgi:glycosyltransferase involved in cell wall biosynthesis
MTHIHLVEPLSSGHRMHFIKRLVETQAPNVTWSLSTFPSTRQHPIFAEIASRFSQIHEIPGEVAFLSGLKGRGGFSQSRQWRSLFAHHWQSLTVDARGDLAFLPFLDYCLYASGWSGLPFLETPVAGIAMRPTFHYRNMGVAAPYSCAHPFQCWLLGRLLRQPRLVRFLTIDEPLRDWIDRFRPGHAAKTTYIQDPADLLPGATRTAGRARFGIPEHQRIVLVYGAISLRKGIQALLEALSIGPCHSDLAVLLVGRWEDSVRPLLETPHFKDLHQKGRLHLFDSYADAKLEALAFATADVVWMVYRNFYGSSGVLMQAAMAGVPVIGSHAGLIGWMIKKHDLGEAIKDDAPSTIVDGIERLTKSSHRSNKSHLRNPPSLGAAVLKSLGIGMSS